MSTELDDEALDLIVGGSGSTFHTTAAVQPGGPPASGDPFNAQAQFQQQQQLNQQSMDALQQAMQPATSSSDTSSFSTQNDIMNTNQGSPLDSQISHSVGADKAEEQYDGYLPSDYQSPSASPPADGHDGPPATSDAGDHDGTAQTSDASDHSSDGSPQDGGNQYAGGGGDGGDGGGGGGGGDGGDADA